MQSINDFLTEDHRRLDEFIEGFQEWKDKDSIRAKEFLSQFAAGLHRHLRWEEMILFPAFEEKTGQSGLIRTLLGEHQEIREWLQALTARVEEGTASEAEEKMLVEELGGHNGREEYALYPELDRLLSDEEKARILATLR